MVTKVRKVTTQIRRYSDPTAVAPFILKIFGGSDQDSRMKLAMDLLPSQ